MDLEKKFDEVIERIEKARLETNEYNIVQIVAVSKYVTHKEIQALYELGQRAFGENKVQDLKEKSEILEELPISWHFIGRLQKNKINHLLDVNPFLIQSCDSLDLAYQIDKRAKNKNKKVNVLLQINSAKEPQKAGVMPEVAVEEYLKIQESCENLNLMGVMSMGAHTSDEKEIEKSFNTTYKIFEKLKDNGAKYCSMGMSNDFELAIRCGSNMVRIGSVLFK